MMADKKFDNYQFKRLRTLFGYTQTIFAEKLDTSQQVIAMIENNNRAVPSSIRENFYKEFGISYDEAIQCTNREDLNIALNKKNISNAILNNLQVASIKFYTDARAAAGRGIEFPDSSSEETLYFDKRWLEHTLGVKADNAIMIQAQGNSMDSGLNRIDDIKDGDLLLVDTSIKEIINNKIFVIQQGNDLRVKKLVKKFNGEVWLISNNERDFQPVPAAEDSLIIGKVVWNGSKENV